MTDLAAIGGVRSKAQIKGRNKETSIGVTPLKRAAERARKTVRQLFDLFVQKMPKQHDQKKAVSCSFCHRLSFFKVAYPADNFDLPDHVVL
jgi:hypothetical protein